VFATRSAGLMAGAHRDLSEFFDVPQCECLNADNTHTLKHALDQANPATFLQSDADEQLLVRSLPSIAPPRRLHLSSADSRTGELAGVQQRRNPSSSPRAEAPPTRKRR
jgi:hypothetical protein